MYVFVCYLCVHCVYHMCVWADMICTKIQGFTGAPFRSCTMMSSGQKSTRNLEQVEYVGLILKPLESHENMFEIRISLGILLLENSYLGNLDFIMIRVFTRVFFDDGFVGWRFPWSDANRRTNLELWHFMTKIVIPRLVLHSQILVLRISRSEFWMFQYVLWGGNVASPIIKHWEPYWIFLVGPESRDEIFRFWSPF